MTEFAMRLAQPLNLLLLPVLAYQGRQVKRSTPLLPEAGTLAGTVAGPGEALRLLVLGDSMAAGVGVEHNDRGLAGQLATQLAEQHGCSVSWRVVGKNGATARSTAKYLTRHVTDPTTGWTPDAVVVIVGINDLVRFRNLAEWKRTTQLLAHDVRRRAGERAVIAFSGMPPVASFPALPQPLRTVMAVRSRLMDARLAKVVHAAGASHVPLPRERIETTSVPFFAEDRFHPSEYGYQLLAGAFVPALTEGLRARGWFQ